MRDLVELAKKLANQPLVRAFGDDLDAIARRQNQRLIHFLAAYKGRQRRAEGIAAEGHSFPDFNRCCFVTESDQCELHH